MNISVSTASAGSGLNPYSFPINPYIYDPAAGTNMKAVETLHGATVWQKKAMDCRQRVLEWIGFKVSDTVFSAQVTKMKTWKGRIIYINFQVGSTGMGKMAESSWPSTNTWKKARVIDVVEKFKPGGTIKYESVQLIIQPEI